MMPPRYLMRTQWRKNTGILILEWKVAKKAQGSTKLYLMHSMKSIRIKFKFSLGLISHINFNQETTQEKIQQRKARQTKIMPFSRLKPSKHIFFSSCNMFRASLNQICSEKIKSRTKSKKSSIFNCTAPMKVLLTTLANTLKQKTHRISLNMMLKHSNLLQNK
jgi:hypothetical protein